MHNWKTWTKRLLIVLVVTVSLNAYGYGMHLVLDRDELPPSRSSRLMAERDFTWMAGGTERSHGEYFILIGGDENVKWFSFGNVDYDNLGPITFDGTNSVPYFYEDTFDQD